MTLRNFCFQQQRSLKLINPRDICLIEHITCTPFREMGVIAACLLPCRRAPALWRMTSISCLVGQQCEYHLPTRSMSSDDGHDGKIQAPKDIPFSDTRKSADPNVFRGPGGYTAAELFQQLQRAERKDGGTQAAAAAAVPVDHGVACPSVEQLHKMTIKELKAILHSLNQDYSDCIDKDSLVERAIQAAASASRQRTD